MTVIIQYFNYCTLFATLCLHLPSNDIYIIATSIKDTGYLYILTRRIALFISQKC